MRRGRVSGVGAAARGGCRCASLLVFIAPGLGGEDVFRPMCRRCAASGRGVMSPDPERRQPCQAIPAVQRASTWGMSATGMYIAAVGIPCRDALSERLETVHLRLDPTSSLVSRPSRGTLSRRAGRPGGGRALAAGQPSFRCRPVLRIGMVRAACRSVMPVRQHGTVASTARDHFHAADVRRDRLHGRMTIAPLALALNAPLSWPPFGVAGERDPGAVRQQALVFCT